MTPVIVSKLTAPFPLYWVVIEVLVELKIAVTSPSLRVLFSHVITGIEVACTEQFSENVSSSMTATMHGSSNSDNCIFPSVGIRVELGCKWWKFRHQVRKLDD
jgi:FlaG/FlaF family flagellin (archaellin)